ncbi:MAG: pyridoxal-dependent decarboxylase [Rhodobacteraceae bacterium]|nr:pyridoxal-dependent decarboxylase [Paracoccaceae bacterium]
MQYSDLSHWAARAGKWAAGYYSGLRDRPVRSKLDPGEFLRQIPLAAPEEPEPMERLFADFETMIPDAMTHWQHPRFFAYFPANAAPASILAEQLISSLACNCMLWQTSPAGTELEIRMLEWFREAVALPPGFSGLIHDSATTSTLCAVLTMRERALQWQGLAEGLSGSPRLRIYASEENHSSIDKAARLSGIGQSNLVKIATDESLAMHPAALRKAIEEDLAAGLTPAGVVVCVGGTANGAFDKVRETIEMAKEFDLYCHADAAWAGSAMLCPEFRWLWDGIENADSIVINPNKWAGVQMDCSIQFLAEPDQQASTVGMRPEYLKTHGKGGMVDFNELTIPLGRRFRALKLWFVFRAYGLAGLREMFRNHVKWIRAAELKLGAEPDIEIVTSSPLALFSFRLAPAGGDADRLTELLLQRINDDGRIYLTPSAHRGRNAIRMTAGTFSCTEEDVMSACQVIREMASSLTGAVKPSPASR